MWRSRGRGAIATGLRPLHDLDPGHCTTWTHGTVRSTGPASTRIDGALALARSLTRQLFTPPPVTRLVACRGNVCVPKAPAADDGSFAAAAVVGSSPSAVVVTTRPWCRCHGEER